MSSPMDDDPLDLAAVAADDEVIELLRAGGPAGDDRALTLLRDLLADVEADLPPATPVGRGTTVLAVAGEVDSERRLARKGGVVVALTAGLLSLGGVAAASSFAPVGSPLHDIGEAVRSAAGAVVGAVTPPEAPGRGPVVLPTAAASPAVTAPVRVAPPRPAAGATAAATARSQAAYRQVVQLLDAAEALLADGRTTAAVTRLDLAERKLAEVAPGDRGALPARLAALRERAQQAPARKSAEPAAPQRVKPSPGPREQPEQKPTARRQAPDRKPDEPKGEGRPASPKGNGGNGRSLVGQLSDSDASAKPRA